MRVMASKTIPFVPVSLLLKFPIRTDWFIMNVKCPIYVFHGMKDELVPFKHSLRLKKIKPDIKLIAIQHGMHSNLAEFPEYQKRLKEILS
jgi:dipeptidyl aminopeptidase/acylaminoacyl peptidase